MIGGGLCTYFDKQDQRSIVGPLNKTIWDLKSKMIQKIEIVIFVVNSQLYCNVTPELFGVQQSFAHL